MHNFNRQNLGLINYRFSGHETFPCRFAWLPKAAHAISEFPDILTSAREDDAMVKLGVGKNMVRSIRFWAEAADVIISNKTGHSLTAFGQQLLKECDSYDPYLEDIQTLWLIHWKLATNTSALIFSWDYLLNKFHEPEIHASSAVRLFSRDVTQVSDRKISQGSLEQLYNVFVHSYMPTRGRKGEVGEDNLDCPLVELDFLRHTGFTRSALTPGRAEAKYAFRAEEKPEISPALFAFCLEEFWGNRRTILGAIEKSIPLHLIVSGHGSPGQVFKIPEPDIRTRLLGLDKHTDRFFTFEESAAIPCVVRNAERQAPSLGVVYGVTEDV